MDRASAQAAAVLERHLGLSAGSVGGRVIAAALHRRLVATAADPAAYLRLLATDRRELTELAEAVLVPETWFFRYPESFRQLAGWAAARRAKAGTGRPLRVLSVPCSTGEEPYSVAVSLLDAGLPAGAFRVDAVDVSPRAVGVARAGVYGSNSFRDRAVEPYLPRYFDQSDAEAALGAEVRRAVTFRTGNLADPRFLADEPPYDAIFCRNLFIYLTDAARRAAVATLDRLLTPDGLIFMGHAEPLGLLDGRFKSTGPPQAFAFVRAAAQTGSGSHPALPAPSGDGAPSDHFLALALGNGSGSYRALAEAVAAGGSGPTNAEPQAGGVAVVPVVGPSLLSRARAAADLGKLPESAALCEQSLAANGPSADAYALLGVIHETGGRLADAAGCFTRALFLEPGHYDALVHMLALAEIRGDPAAAANYRRRADSAARREATP